MEVLRPQEDRISIPGPSTSPSQEQLFHGQRAFSRHTWIPCDLAIHLWVAAFLWSKQVLMIIQHHT